MDIEKEITTKIIFWITFCPIFSFIMSALLWRFTIIRKGGKRQWLMSCALGCLCAFIAFLYGLFNLSDDLTAYLESAKTVVEQYNQ